MGQYDDEEDEEGEEGVNSDEESEPEVRQQP